MNKVNLQIYCHVLILVINAISFVKSRVIAFASYVDSKLLLNGLDVKRCASV